METPIQKARTLADSFQPAYHADTCYLYCFTGTAELHDIYNAEGLLADWYYTYDPSDSNHVCYFGIGNMVHRYLRHTNNTKRKINPPQENRIVLRKSLSIADVFELEVQMIKAFGKLFEGGCLVNESDGGPGCSGRRVPDTYFDDHKETLLANANWYYLIDEEKTVLDRGTANGLANKYGIDCSSVSAIARGKTAGAWHEKTRRRLIFCRVEDYKTFVVKPCKALREIVVVSPKGEVDVGLGRELVKRYQLDHVHRAADPEKAGQTDRGFTCYYKDLCPADILAKVV